MQQSANRSPLHYGWVIVFTGTLCILACLGFGRFALGMLLPSMAQTLKLTYSQMGFISTANFVGYLISVLISGFLAMRIGARKLIFIALVLVGASMILVSRANDFGTVLVLYLLTGIGSGAANVPVMGLVSHWFASTIRGRAAGFIVIGSGFAIIISGKLIPFINRVEGAEGWRVSWLILGCSVLVIAFVGALLLRNDPKEKGLEPLGSADTAAFYSRIINVMKTNIYRKRVIYHLGIIYFLFGYTYVIYATFIVTTLVKERGFSETLAGDFWSWVGILSLVSGPVFGTLSDKLGRKTGLLVVFFLQALSYLLVASGLPGAFLYLSIGFYGIVAWSIPSIMAAAVGDYVGAQRAGQAFGFVTFIFGFGQIIGPAVAGVLAEKTGSFSGSFSMAAAFAGAAILLTAFLRKPESAHEGESPLKPT
ncbi:MAG: MFS transporter [Nitrospirae bacterium]|nr:MFS transporter [Nitrospirota bacterium]